MGAAVMGIFMLLVTGIVVWRVEDYRQNYAAPEAIAEEREVAAWWKWAKSLPTPDSGRIPSAIDTSQRAVSGGRTVGDGSFLEALHERTQHGSGGVAARTGPKHAHARGRVRTARGAGRPVGGNAPGRHRFIANL